MRHETLSQEFVMLIIVAQHTSRYTHLPPTPGYSGYSRKTAPNDRCELSGPDQEVRFRLDSEYFREVKNAGLRGRKHACSGVLLGDASGVFEVWVGQEEVVSGNSYPSLPPRYMFLTA